MTNVHKFLRHTTLRTMERRTVVYKMICDECDMVFIDQTGRAFIQRFKAHLPESNFNTIKSKYAKHLTTHDHKHTDFESSCKTLYVRQRALHERSWGLGCTGPSRVTYWRTHGYHIHDNYWLPVCSVKQLLKLDRIICTTELWARQQWIDAYVQFNC